MTVQAATVTKIGRTLFLEALRTQQPIDVTSAVITDVVLPCTGDEIDLPSTVFTMTPPQLLVYSPGPGVMRFALPMDATIGNFTIGTIGLFANTTLIALAAFPNAGQKIHNALPNTLGNIRTFYVDVGYSDISTVINPLATIVPPNIDPIVSALIYG